MGVPPFTETPTGSHCGQLESHTIYISVVKKPRLVLKLVVVVFSWKKGNVAVSPLWRFHVLSPPHNKWQWRCNGSQGVLAAHGQGYRVTTNYNPSYGKWLDNPITLDLRAAESFWNRWPCAPAALLQPWRWCSHRYPQIGRNQWPRRTWNAQSSWWLNNPSENYACQTGPSPQVGVNILKIFENTTQQSLLDWSWSVVLFGISWCKSLNPEVSSSVKMQQLMCLFERSRLAAHQPALSMRAFRCSHHKGAIFEFKQPLSLTPAMQLEHLLWLNSPPWSQRSGHRSPARSASCAFARTNRATSIP